MARIASLFLKGTVALTFCVAGFASAASLNSSTATAAAGTASVPRCDTDGIAAAPTLAADSVASVSVSGIASTCATMRLSVGVANGSVSGTGTVTIPAGGGTVSVPIAPAVPLTTGVTVDVVIAEAA